ncbi:MAG TPA: CinA family nicotinamide mononucleotide deamidase-related protein [Thermomicrobiales bacterium]|nr:CinA family nicotinamide mononucleotide deamidase-related protein [Thermomicrobiales bacterium]
MRAHVLSIGAELLLGHLTDTNATYLAQELAGQGVELIGVSQVGDDVQRIVDALRWALRDAKVVICTGGVGPTEDDLTREAIAALVGEEPVVDAVLRQQIEAFFAARGQPMPERNAKQAWLIPSGEALPNPVGTAPGWFVRHGDARIVAMPGVPREMFRMWREQALPRLRDALPGEVFRSITFKTLGIGESSAEQELGDLVGLANPVVATYAKDDGVHIRITARADNAEVAERARDEVATEVRRRLGTYIYGTDATTLAAALAALLAAGGHRLGVCEAGSGGRLIALLQSIPASPSVVAGGTALPAVEGDGAHAESLAHEAMSAFEATLGIGLSLTATPNDQNVWSGEASIAIRGRLEATDRQTFRAAFDDLNRRAALGAADLLRRTLITRDGAEGD